mmetsp:Transcript_45026/g.108906  ORF Transcript_45026/g.108906 Transcript_45026/m.108906 type:complete len:718 (+) Transcript_45026:633-2786(+)
MGQEAPNESQSVSHWVLLVLLFISLGLSIAVNKSCTFIGFADNEFGLGLDNRNIYNPESGCQEYEDSFETDTFVMIGSSASTMHCYFIATTAIGMFMMQFCFLTGRERAWASIRLLMAISLALCALTFIVYLQDLCFENGMFTSSFTCALGNDAKTQIVNGFVSTLAYAMLSCMIPGRTRAIRPPSEDSLDDISDEGVHSFDSVIRWIFFVLLFVSTIFSARVASGCSFLSVDQPRVDQLNFETPSIFVGLGDTYQDRSTGECVEMDSPSVGTFQSISYISCVVQSVSMAFAFLSMTLQQCVLQNHRGCTWKVIQTLLVISFLLCLLTFLAFLRDDCFNDNFPYACSLADGSKDHLLNTFLLLGILPMAFAPYGEERPIPWEKVECCKAAKIDRHCPDDDDQNSKGETSVAEAVTKAFDSRDGGDPGCIETEMPEPQEMTETEVTETEDTSHNGVEGSTAECGAEESNDQKATDTGVKHKRKKRKSKKKKKKKPNSDIDIEAEPSNSGTGDDPMRIDDEAPESKMPCDDVKGTEASNDEKSSDDSKIKSEKEASTKNIDCDVDVATETGTDDVPGCMESEIQGPQEVPSDDVETNEEGSNDGISDGAKSKNGSIDYDVEIATKAGTDDVPAYMESEIRGPQEVPSDDIEAIEEGSNDEMLDGAKSKNGSIDSDVEAANSETSDDHFDVADQNQKLNDTEHIDDSDILSGAAGDDDQV